MKARTLLLCGLLMMTPAFAARAHGPSHRTAAVPQGPKIRVLLEKDVTSAIMEVKGNYRVTRIDNGAVLSYGGTGKRFVVHALQDGLRWGEEYPDVFQISLVPNSSDTCVYVNGMQYKGAINIYHVHNNRITIVNEVAIEDYLKSVMTLDYPSQMPQEAMRALAIAARTHVYGLTLASRNATRPWDISAKDSGYYGYGVTQQRIGVEEAVEWTRFMVVESLRDNTLMHGVVLGATEAQKLASLGHDAQKILKAVCPQAKFGVTINANEVAIR